jgi:hypothetical protein
MKWWSLAAGLLTMLTAAGTASANVSSVKLFAGRLATPESCFVQVDVEVDEQDKQNGQESLAVGDTDFGTWTALVSANKKIAAGKSVLYGSSAFATEAGITPDIEVPGSACAKMTPKTVLNFNGSFGPVAGTLTIPDDFSELQVVGELLLIHLESESYRVKSLEAEKEIGGASSSSGASSSGESSSGGASSGGVEGVSSSGSSPTPSDDGGCQIGSARSSFATPWALGILTIVLGFVVRRGRAALGRRA